MSREKKRIPDFDHILCLRFEHNYLTKLDYRKWEQVKQFVLIQSYRPFHTFGRTYLAAWMQIQQLTEGEQNISSNCSPSVSYKFESMLQDIKILPACKTAKILTAFLILRKKKKKLVIFLTMLTQTNNFPFKYRHRKQIKAWKTECEDR